jgi:uncharacterized protein (DUF2384 family)
MLLSGCFCFTMCLFMRLDTFDGRENTVSNWLRTPIVALNDQSPLQIMDTVTGFGLGG